MDYSPKKGTTYKITRVVCGELVVTHYPWLSRRTKDVNTTSIICVNNEPYLSNSGRIQYCDETEQWELSNKVVKGMLSKGVEGTLKLDRYKTVTAIRSSGKTNFIRDEELALEMGLLPSLSLDGFYYPNDASNFVKEMQTKATFGIDVRTTHHADEKNSAFRKITKVYTEHSPKIGEDAVTVAKLLGKLTFGIEFETAVGAVQRSALGKLGIVPLVDGSLNSRDQYEYTTVVMQGAKGLQSVKDICKRLSSQCAVDRTCALHVHVGSLPRNKEFIISLYQLFYRLQDEMFNMVPYYKRHEASIMGKGREYSERLVDLGFQDNNLYSKKSYTEYNKELDEMYNKLFEFASCGQKVTKDFNSQLVRDGQINTPWNRQWDCPTRYYAMNIVNYLFSKSGTVEFRLHSPTLSFQKTSIWLMICVALVRYATKYHRRILEGEEKIRLKDVIDAMKNNFGEEVSADDKIYFEVISDTIKNYIKIRKDLFKQRYTNAVHNTLNNRNNINTEYVRSADTEFKTDHIEIKEIGNIY